MPDPNITLRANLNDYADWQWAPDIDPECGDWGLFVNQNNHIDIPPGDSEIAITGIRIILNNSFAPMPVSGHSYATHQFIGRGPTEFSISLASIGDRRISSIQSMIEELELNAREYRKFASAGAVLFSNNPFLHMAGVLTGIVSSVDTQTDSEGTNLYNCQISFTSEGHHTERFEQESFTQSDIYSDLVDSMMQRVAIEVIRGDEARSLFQELESRPDRTAQFYSGVVARSMGETLGDAIVPDLAYVLTPFAGSAEQIAQDTLGGVMGSTAEEAGGNISRGIRALASSIGYGRNSGDLFSAQGMLDAISSEGSILLTQAGDYISGGQEEIDRQRARGAYTRFPVRTPGSGVEVFTRYQPASEGIPDWMRRYITEVNETLIAFRGRLPPHEFFVGERRGQYITSRAPSEEGREDSETPVEGGRTETINQWPPLMANESSRLCQILYGTREVWPAMTRSSLTDQNLIERELFQLENRLNEIAREMHQENSWRPEYHETFPNITTRLAESQAVTSHPCYPDMDLPRHPGTGLEIHTNPDFYFFNDGEEGLLNQVGPDVVQEIERRIDSMIVSFGRLNSGQEWRETYLGRSRFGPNDLEPSGTMSNLDEDNQMEGTPELVIDSTNPGGNAEEGQSRKIGGGPEDITNSVVNSILNLSPIVRASTSTEQETLRRRRTDMMRNTIFSLPDGDPNGLLNVGPIDTALGEDDKTHSFARNSIRRIVHESIIHSADDTLTMRRAFPTFKVYFIEEDTGARQLHRLGTDSSGQVRPVMYFDDLYSYNSVRSIRMISSRKSPADLLILEVTNVTGLLERRTFTHPTERTREIYSPGFDETELENPLKKLILKEGLKVQARLGYKNDPNSLPNKFVGEVVELSYNQDAPDQITIICQSYGNELTLEPKGAGPDQEVVFHDTPDLIHTMMCSPELVHLGRYNLNPSFNPAEARSAASSRSESGNGLGLLSSRTEINDALRERLVRNRSRFFLANNPADDNIFAPGIRDYLTSWDRGMSNLSEMAVGAADLLESYSSFSHDISSSIGAPNPLGWVASTIGGWEASGLRALGEWLNIASYTPMGQTIWQILKECELRHPGWMVQVVPYGTRSTVFFGVPDHEYWSDQMSQQEIEMLNQVSGRLFAEAGISPARGLRQLWNSFTRGNRNRTGITERMGYLIHRTMLERHINRHLSASGERIARTLGRLKPFRDYHLLTSDHHILINNIRASDKGTFNAVNLVWNDGAIYSLKADDNIPEERTRVETFNYPSCENETLARRYCIGLLNRHLKDIYKGEIIVTGMNIKPRDICVIHDDRLGMYGPIEVEQVVDTFTPETGWITEITPDLITGTNEFSTATTSQCRMMVLIDLATKYKAQTWNAVNSVAGITTNVAFGASALVTNGASAVQMAAGAVLAWMGGYYVIRWTQDRQPIWVCPLILGERPFFAGLDGFRQDGLFSSLRGDLRAEIDALSEGWRRFHLSAYANDATITLAQRIAGQAGV